MFREDIVIVQSRRWRIPYEIDEPPRINTAERSWIMSTILIVAFRSAKERSCAAKTTFRLPPAKRRSFAERKTSISHEQILLQPRSHGRAEPAEGELDAEF